MIRHLRWYIVGLLTGMRRLIPSANCRIMLRIRGHGRLMGGALSQWYVGDVIQLVGYRSVFTVAGCLHPIAAILILLCVRSRPTIDIEGRLEHVAISAGR